MQKATNASKEMHDSFPIINYSANNDNDQVLAETGNLTASWDIKNNYNCPRHCKTNNDRMTEIKKINRRQEKKPKNSI